MLTISLYGNQLETSSRLAQLFRRHGFTKVFMDRVNSGPDFQIGLNTANDINRIPITDGTMVRY